MPTTFLFADWPVPINEIFFISAHSLGLVNPKPVVPGHVLVIPRRRVQRYHELTSAEVADLMTSAQAIGKAIEHEFGGESITISVQDGPAAGQSIAHVHVHILPRKTGDFADNNDIYPEINRKERDLVEQVLRKGADSTEDVVAEAARLRKLFVQFEDIWADV
ncbi:hypothetical protein HDU96_009582 [Phlyctochytrium bullatum]|nr:hypothetical protein HDU96_009582 [Phlyctochytrium bullatum]